jgi:pyrroline-5-carboxylate reductase
MTDSRSPRILFIGGGNMAAAMIGALVGSSGAAGYGRPFADGSRQDHGPAGGSGPDREPGDGSGRGREPGNGPGPAATGRPHVTVVEPEAQARAALERRFAVATEAAPQASLVADAFVLAVKPQVAATALMQARSLLAANGDAVLVSIAAGTTLATIRAASGGHRTVVRAMPNTPALIGQGVTGLYIPDGTAAALAALAEWIVASTGTVVRVHDEAALDAVTAVSGSGPAYVFYLIEAMIKGARNEGLADADARALVLATVRGAALLAEASDEPADVLRRRVTSPNGTTAAAIAEFDRRGVMDAVVAAIAAARRRSEELGASS